MEEEMIATVQIEREGERELLVSVNTKRAIKSAIQATTNLTDSIRELLQNSIDAIENPSEGVIEVDLREREVVVRDNGRGGVSPERFVEFYRESPTAAKISMNGYGLKTIFGYFKSVSILSRESKGGPIMYVKRFTAYGEFHEINSRCVVALYNEGDPGYEELSLRLGKFNTEVAASDPLENTDLSELYEVDKRQCPAPTHISAVLNEPVFFLKAGGKIKAVKEDGGIVQGHCHSEFSPVDEENSKSFRSDEAIDLWGKTIAPIFSDSPDRAVTVNIALIKENEGGGGIQGIYLDNARVVESIADFCGVKLRHGTSPRLQLLVRLPNYYKDNGLITFNKHGLRNSGPLREYLSTILKRCDYRIKKITKKLKSETMVAGEDTAPPPRKQTFGFRKVMNQTSQEKTSRALGIAENDQLFGWISQIKELERKIKERLTLLKQEE